MAGNGREIDKDLRAVAGNTVEPGFNAGLDVVLPTALG